MRRLGIEYISGVMRTGRLYWFGDEERKDENSWVKCIKCFEADGAPADMDEVLKSDLEITRVDNQAT